MLEEEKLVHRKERKGDVKEGLALHGRNDMPTVGKKKFAYTPKGKAAAKKYAAKRGNKVVKKK